MGRMLSKSRDARYQIVPKIMASGNSRKALLLATNQRIGGKRRGWEILYVLLRHPRSWEESEADRRCLALERGLKDYR
jgi:hypothetical protein